MKLLWDNKLAVFYFLGFVLTAYLKLPAVAVAILGIVICVVVSQRDVEISKLLTSGVGTSKNSGTMTSEDEEGDFFA